MDFIDDDKELEADAWKVLVDLLPEIDDPAPAGIESASLFVPRLYERLAVQFLRQGRHEAKSRFLTYEQLYSIALEERERGRTGLASDIDEEAGVYLFIALCGPTILKVGQTQNLRQRIAKDHLCNGRLMTTSRLVDHCQARWDWPDCLREQQIVAVLLPMPGSCDVDRCIVESSLQKLLSPEMS